MSSRLSYLPGSEMDLQDNGVAGGTCRCLRLQQTAALHGELLSEAATGPALARRTCAIGTSQSLIKVLKPLLTHPDRDTRRFPSKRLGHPHFSKRRARPRSDAAEPQLAPEATWRNAYCFVHCVTDARRHPKSLVLASEVLRPLARVRIAERIREVVVGGEGAEQLRGAHLPSSFLD